MLIDIHCHLELVKDLDNVIKRANIVGVGKILTCGTNSNLNKKALEFFEKYENVFACLGMYPHDALQLSDEEIDKEIKFIRKNKNKVVAIGEVGLDLLEDDEDTLDRQKSILKKFVLLAQDLNVPVAVHSRKAEKYAVELLEEIGYKKILMHCFSGNLKLVQRVIDNGWYLSIPTNVKHSQHFQKLIELTPIEQLFCETDAPFLHPNKERNNEPGNVVVSYQKISEIKGIEIEEVQKKIVANYRRIFEL